MLSPDYYGAPLVCCAACLSLGDVCYAYATNAQHMNIQVIRSTDLINWERVGENGDALFQLPEWAALHQSLTWMPSVLHRDGEFIVIGIPYRK